ncbi:hypothetical protein DRQ18_01585 [bacterium]|nr:MAG: hypothetical protein DRQ18_01585 [bacterium]
MKVIKTEIPYDIFVAHSFALFAALILVMGMISGRALSEKIAVEKNGAGSSPPVVNVHVGKDFIAMEGRRITIAEVEESLREKRVSVSWDEDVSADRLFEILEILYQYDCTVTLSSK